MYKQAEIIENSISNAIWYWNLHECTQSTKFLCVSICFNAHMYTLENRVTAKQEISVSSLKLQHNYKIFSFNFILRFRYL